MSRHVSRYAGARPGVRALAGPAALPAGTAATSAAATSLAATAAVLALVLGLAAGLLLHRWLGRRDYRYDDELDLPVRDTRWVVVAVPVAAAAVAAGLAPRAAGLAAVTTLFVPLLVALAAIDIDTHRLPDRFVKPAIPAALAGVGAAALLAADGRLVVSAALGGACLGGFYLLIVLLGLIGGGSGMGLGDAKYAVVLGVLLGAQSGAHIVAATVLTFLTAAAQAVWLLAVRRAGLGAHLAFGPHMTLGALVVLALPGLLAVAGR